MKDHLASTALTAASGEVSWKGLRLAWVFRPQGEAGGDRFVVERRDETVYFAIADAAGHGARGARFWLRHAGAFEDLWCAMLAQHGDAEPRLRALADALDARLAANGSADDYLCLSLGAWTGDSLTFANCGYGTHVLPRAAPHWWADPEQLVGVKLGWLGPELRAGMPDSWARNAVGDVDRVVLATDGILGDDHADPRATLAGLGSTLDHVSKLPFEDVLPELEAGAPDPTDDLTLVILERT